MTNTGYNLEPPVPHTHPEVRRSQTWIFVAFVILVIATTIALTRQAQNFQAHKSLDKRICSVAAENRKLLEDTLRAFLDNPTIPPQIQQIARDQINRIEASHNDLPNCAKV